LKEFPLKDILIVDDDQEWREQLVDVIASEKYSAETADSYATASHALQTNRFKLAVIDVRLEDADPENRDGLRLLRDIDKDNMDIRVIIITGYGTEDDEEVARRSPRFHAFIYKSKFNLLDFRNLVQEAVS
jgi:DNA-binding NtrC family response regulator